MVTKKSDALGDASKHDSNLDLKDIGIDLADKTIDIDPRTLPVIVLSIVLCGLVFMLIDNVAQTMTAFIIALLFALALDPVVNKISTIPLNYLPFRQRKEQDGKYYFSRYQSVGIVLCVFFFAIILIGFLLAPKVIIQVQNLATEIPQSVHNLGNLPIIGKHLGSVQIQARIKDALEKAPEYLSSRDSPLGDLLRSFANGAYVGFLFVLMFIAMLLDGPRFIRNIRRLIRVEHRDAADRIGKIAYSVIGRYMAGSIFVAISAGIVIGVAGLLLDVPLAPLLGLWVIGTNLIPQIGGFLGGVPFVVFGFTVSPLTGFICLAVFLTYQQIENHIILPIVIGKTVHISPPVTMIAALIGVAAGGVVGAMIAVPCVGGAKALAAEFDFPRGAREKSLREEKTSNKGLRKKLLALINKKS